MLKPGDLVRPTLHENSVGDALPLTMTANLGEVNPDDNPIVAKPMHTDVGLVITSHCPEPNDALHVNLRLGVAVSAGASDMRALKPGDLVRFSGSSSDIALWDSASGSRNVIVGRIKLNEVGLVAAINPYVNLVGNATPQALVLFGLQLGWNYTSYFQRISTR